MIHADTDNRLRRAVRAIVLVPAVAMALMLPAAPAQASCVTNAIGIANSQGNVAAIAATHACAPAYGQPVNHDTGRKVG